MKPTAMLLTVILLMTGSLLVGGSFITKNKTDEFIPDCNALPKMPLKKEEPAPVSQPVKLIAVKPHIGTIERNGDGIECDVISPVPLMKEENDSDRIFMCNVAREAEYPGGQAAWQRYLNKSMRIPEEAIDNESQGTVVVQFVVDEDGNVSNVEAVSGPKVLGAEAVRVIKQSGKWIPAQQIQNGRYIKSYKRQPFIIHLEAEE